MKTMSPRDWEVAEDGGQEVHQSGARKESGLDVPGGWGGGQEGTARTHGESGTTAIMHP